MLIYNFIHHFSQVPGSHYLSFALVEVMYIYKLLDYLGSCSCSSYSILPDLLPELLVLDKVTRILHGGDKGSRSIPLWRGCLSFSDLISIYLDKITLFYGSYEFKELLFGDSNVLFILSPFLAGSALLLGHVRNLHVSGVCKHLGRGKELLAADIYLQLSSIILSRRIEYG